jgi:hypothetical protein
MALEETDHALPFLPDSRIKKAQTFRFIKVLLPPLNLDM